MVFVIGTLSVLQRKAKGSYSIAMKVISIGLDASILDAGSAVRKRMVALAEKAGAITVFVPAVSDTTDEVSEHLTIHSVCGIKPLQLLKLWQLISQELRVTTYDLITVQDTYFIGFLAVQLGKKFSIPVEVQVHGLEQFSGFRKWIAGFVIRRADRIRVVSERLKRELDSRFKIQDSRMYILPVYTQIEIPERTTKRKTVPYPFTFLTVGRLVSVKNIALQIRAFAKLAKMVPHIQLRIVGDGPLKEVLKAEVRSLDLQDQIIFEGYQTEVNRFYEEADAFLLTSDSEGWGRVVLEAAAHRLPIIMTNVGLAQEVIKNEESGLIIPVGDEGELVLAMRELLDKPELRTRLAEGACKAFKSLPSREEHIRKQVEQWAGFK